MILEELIRQFSLSGGLLGLIVLMLFALIFFILYMGNKVTIVLLAALKQSLLEEDHEFKHVKQVAYKNNLLPERRKHRRDK